jgi:hypothetical protein
LDYRQQVIAGWLRFTFWVLLLLPTGCVSRQTPARVPGLGDLPSQPGLPDPLRKLDGRTLDEPSEWFKERRPELKQLFADYVYGPIPPKPDRLQAKVIGSYPGFLDGAATLKLVTLQPVQRGNPKPGPPIDLMLVLPNYRSQPAPIFLAMDFCGNHAITRDARVPLSRSWMAKSCPGCSNNLATEASRGSQSTNWPLAEIVRRGYAFAAFYSGDVDSDRSDASTGLYEWLAARDASKNNPTNRGTLAAWAWGFQRCVDYLLEDPGVDRRRIAVIGHSRNGKTALLAAATDERIAMAFAHQAGCGGTAPSRGKTGESVKAINDHFPYWFNAEFKKFNEEPEGLPIDQNCLIALCAPRPVLVSAAEGDTWSNPAGQFQNVQSADRAYRFIGVDGLTPVDAPVLQFTNAPPLNQLVGHRLGFYMRAGNHSMIAADWNLFLDFADKQWRR